MKTLTTLVGILALLVLGAAFLLAQGQAPQHAPVIIPASSQEHAADIGKKAHTNHLILALPRSVPAPTAGETPQTIYPVYGLTLDDDNSGGIIAIVDAFDYPTAEDDLHTFSQQFGLPECRSANGCFQVIYAGGTKPPANCGWAQEAALDIEWAHAMAPNAKIVLVEAASNSFADLFQAVDVASAIINPSGEEVGTGLGQVSMSWSGTEFRFETAYDSHFTTSGVVYFAASGDTGGKVPYPCASPNVVCAGGTTIHRDSSGAFLSETAWSGSGGGSSKYEFRPPYQDGILKLVHAKRGVPDFSFDADPYSGVAVYDSTPCQGYSGWLVFGGTSVSAPSLAGIVNFAGSKYSSGANELGTIYSYLGDTSAFRDITVGKAGRYRAMPGWDFITGVGSNQGVVGK
jgi:kumamolisin